MGSTPRFDSVASPQSRSLGFAHYKHEGSMRANLTVIAKAIVVGLFTGYVLGMVLAVAASAVYLVR